MASVTYDYLINEILLHSHKAGDISDLTTVLDPRYLVLAGVSGGQTAIGGTGITDILKLQGTTGNGTLTSPAIQLRTGNNGATTAVTVLNNGNVGIGTTAPAAKLDIQNPSSTSTPSLSLLGAGTYGSGYLASLGNYGKMSQSSAGANYLTWGAYHNGSAWNRTYGGALGLVNVAIGTGPVFSVQTDEATSGTPSFTDRLTVANGGNVGIGTANPGAKLEVAGQVKITGGVPGINKVLTSDAAGLATWTDISSTAGPWTLSGTNLYPDSTTYKVGIGTTNPTAKLQVHGGDLIINNAGTGVLRGDNYNLGTGGALLVSSSNSAASQYIQLGKALSGTGAFTPYMTVMSSGNVGIGTTAPTSILALGGNSARVFQLERHTTSNTAGNTLTITAGGATSGATDKAGGALILQGGLSTGSAESGVTIQGCVAGATGTTDRTQTTMIQVLGNKIGFFTSTPVVQQTELTDELTTITHTAPGTPDYAIQDLTNIAPYGFASQDEGNTVLSVIANLQARVNELETKLVNYGLLVDAD